MICDKCKNEILGIDTKNYIFEGILRQEYMSMDEIDIEEIELESGEIIYYYFEEKDREIIAGSRDVCGRARGMCLECMKESINRTFEEKDPHYGDGVYFTLNNKLNVADNKVKFAHGEQVARRIMRSKFIIKRDIDLIKINNTCGVIKTDEVKEYRVNELIFANKNRQEEIVQYICQEEYINGEWCCI